MKKKSKRDSVVESLKQWPAASTLSASKWFGKWRQRFRTNPETGLPLRPRRYWTGQHRTLSIERLAFETGDGLRWALRLFPPFCLALFGLSMFWDFYGVIRSCSIAGLIGFGTNWVAIRMLFWPHENRPIFGQGLIPSQRNEIIFKVADEVCEKLINEEIIRRELEDSRLIPRLTAATVDELRLIVRNPEFVADTKSMLIEYATRLTKSEAFRAELLKTAEERVLLYAGQSLTTWVAGRFKGLWRSPLLRIVNQELEALPETIDRLAVDIDEMLKRLPLELERNLGSIDTVMTRVIMSMIREIDVPGIILKQLDTVTTQQIEDAFHSFADDKLSYITILGGILGLVGGFVIVWPIQSVLILAGVGTLLAGLDVLLFRLLPAPAVRPVAPVPASTSCSSPPTDADSP